MKKTEILTFIYSHDLCVLSTVNPKNTPEAAVIKFAITNNFFSKQEIDLLNSDNEIG